MSWRCGFEKPRLRRTPSPATRCRHNLNYWNFGDYLGIGAGAHGKMSFADRIVRTVKHKHPKPTQRGDGRGGAGNARRIHGWNCRCEFVERAAIIVRFPTQFAERGLGLNYIARAKPGPPVLIDRDHRAVRATGKGALF